MLRVVTSPRRHVLRGLIGLNIPAGRTSLVLGRILLLLLLLLWHMAVVLHNNIFLVSNTWSMLVLLRSRSKTLRLVVIHIVAGQLHCDWIRDRR